MSVEKERIARVEPVPGSRSVGFEALLQAFASRKNDPGYPVVVNNVLSMWEALVRQHSTALKGLPGKDAPLEEVRAYVVSSIADAFQTQIVFLTAGVSKLEDALEAKAFIKQLMASELARIDNGPGDRQTKREIKDELRTELNIRYQDVLANMLKRIRSMGKASPTQTVPESGSAPSDDYHSGIAQAGALERSASQYGNPLLDEIYAKAPDRESLQQLIENGGHGLSPSAKKVIELLRERGLVHQLVTWERGLVGQLVTSKAAASAAAGDGIGNESQQEAAPTAPQAAHCDHSQSEPVATVRDGAIFSAANGNAEDITQVLGLLDRMTEQTSIENWAQENHLSRTQVFEFRRSKGQPIHGKLSKRKCAEIAKPSSPRLLKLRLVPTRTNSDS